MVWDALHDLDLGSSPLLRTLFVLRGIPAIRRIGDFEMLGFEVLSEERPSSLNLGLIGRFWSPGGDLVDFEPEEFQTFDRPGYAKAVWGFEIRGPNNGPSTVTTETRVQCTDSRSEKWFRRYWALVGPFSSMTRREMLRLLRRQTASA